ncbi:hypothetical protein HJ588_05545 [Flexivirga sp. ID2601S]|uniref:Uncharacterized protein n=1 Tax=Flexivirga aerilata TaxID=1656889 RepID=A0A849AFT4_9MICO|nr:hypothetical protein [Flexivirga aerilata]NNG38737.1 hypothetical protein [Flexivirga aerilata]
MFAVIVAGRAIVTRDPGALVNALIILALSFVANVGVVRAAITPTFWRPAGAWRRRAWTEVDCVLGPGRYDDTTELRMRDGAVVSTGFPADLAARIAEISGKPLQVPEPKKVTPAQAPSSPWRRPEPTIQERAERLHARHVELMKDAPQGTPKEDQT